MPKKSLKRNHYTKKRGLKGKKRQSYGKRSSKRSNKKRSSKRSNKKRSSKRGGGMLSSAAKIAGKTAAGFANQGFNTVTAKNGSGKSTLNYGADAFRSAAKSGLDLAHAQVKQHPSYDLYQSQIDSAVSAAHNGIDYAHTGLNAVADSAPALKAQLEEAGKKYYAIKQQYDAVEKEDDTDLKAANLAIANEALQAQLSDHGTMLATAASQVGTQVGTQVKAAAHQYLTEDNLKKALESVANIIKSLSEFNSNPIKAAGNLKGEIQEIEMSTFTRN